MSTSKVEILQYGSEYVPNGYHFGRYLRQLWLLTIFLCAQSFLTGCEQIRAPARTFFNTHWNDEHYDQLIQEYNGPGSPLRILAMYPNGDDAIAARIAAQKNIPDLEKSLQEYEFDYVTNIDDKKRRYYQEKIDEIETKLAVVHVPDPFSEVGRDQIISDLSFMVDYNYDHFKEEFRKGTSSLDFVSDIIVLGLNGAGAVTGTAEVKSILAVASAGVVGSTTAFSKDYLHQQTVEAIISQMDAEREVVTQRILRRRGYSDANSQAKGTFVRTAIGEYSTRDAVVDLQDYYDAGTVGRALVTIEKDATNKAAAAKNATNALSTFTTTRPNNDQQAPSTWIPATTTTQAASGPAGSQPR